jgi:ribonuclease-3
MKLAYTFADPGLLERALTHRTWSNEHAGAPDNERLEFLGDAVIQLIVTDLLVASRPGWREGDLSKMRSTLVNRESLHRLAEELGLGPHLRLGVAESQEGWRGRPAAMADAFEAVAGALFTDGGLVAASALLRPLFEALLHGVETAPLDARSALQQLLDARGLPGPIYDIVGEEGPAHEKLFHATVSVVGVAYGPVKARSKAAAFKAVAQEALAALQRG